MMRKMRDNVKDDQEFEMLLEEIPHQFNDHSPSEREQESIKGGVLNVVNDDDNESLLQIKYPCVSSPTSGFSLRSDDSYSSLFSSGGVHENNGSLTPPPLEDIKSGLINGVSYSPMMMKRAGENLADELDLCGNLSKMCLSNQCENPCDFKNGSMGKSEIPFCDFDSSLGGNGNNFINGYKHNGVYENFKRQFSDPVGVIQSPFPHNVMSFGAERNPALSGLPQDYKMGHLFGSRHGSGRDGGIHSRFNGCTGSVDSPLQRRQLINNCHYGANMGIQRGTALGGHTLPDSLLYPRQSGMNLMEDRGISRFPDSSFCTNLRPHLNVRNSQQYNLPGSNARAVPPSNIRIPQGGLEAIAREGSFIIQGEGLNYYPVRGSDHSRAQIKGAGHDTSLSKYLQRAELENRHRILASHRSPSGRTGGSTPFIPEYNSLAEAQGYIYLLAKDQLGCRFLQRVFDEGSPQDVQVIFSEIIEHVVELMINPFGNYLMQKLLDVCNEEQRMQILLMITKEPWQLVTISLNSHGTRVIQKLIETLSTKQEISLVVSVLEPGFLALIKDLNGNHVIQRCLQCLSNEDNKFIFIAAARYCVDIATHQHGCCVLQRCVGRSWGKYREQLVAEISAHAFILAQDQYGNYVIQYILDLRIPSATASIISQFQGHYVQLSTQKFSSHVVEKCLAVFNDDHRAQVIHELLSTPHFEQLLQDPHANYVIQSALQHSKGFVHNKLVDKIESHKAISRNSPYSKRIFSQKFLKK